MTSGLIYALLCAGCFGLYTVFHSSGAMYINSVLGAILVSATAVLFGVMFLVPQLKQGSIQVSGKGLLFVALAGMCAFGIDYFAFKAYRSDIPVSVGGPLIIGGAILVASVVGFVFGEQITLIKLLAILLIVAGASILAALAS